MRAEILTIGDELLRGEIVDTNKSFLSERLLGLDVETRHHVSVCDVPEDMATALRTAVARSDVVVVSGGLGPTRDDLTIEVLARTFGRKLVLHEPSLAALRAFFARFGREMSENNAKQAWLPEGAEALANPIGTAPGCFLEQQGTLVFCLPGVPRELVRMMDEQVLPRIASRRGEGGVVRARLLRTFGLGESNLDERLQGVAADLGATLGFRTQFPDNHVRVLVRDASAAAAEARLEAACAAVRGRLGALVYAEGEETLEAVTGRLLAERGRTIAVAESCSGGLLAERISSVPGASAWFRGGVVAYANAAKVSLLEVPAALLEQHGAVSGAVACAMAEGVRKRFDADFGIGTTGISGPTGGSPDRPVGLVFIALSRAGETRAEELVFPFDRERHRRLTVQVALDQVRRTLLGVEPLALRYGRLGGG